MLYPLWIGFGVLCWIIGFSRGNSTRLNRTNRSWSLLRPHPWIYWICGSPKVPRLPRGVIGLPELIVQLEGIYFVLCGILSYFMSSIGPFLQTLFLFIGTVLICITCFGVYKRYPYHPQ